MNKVKTSDPHKTRSGKTRIRGFQKEYLEILLGETSKPKEKAKIQRRIEQLEKRNG